MDPHDAISRAIARARAQALPAMASNFTHPAWAMSAAEFRAFWGHLRLAGATTVGASGWPHTAPVEVVLSGDRFIVPAFANSVRRRDATSNPRISLIAWDDAWHAAIIYGRVIETTPSTLVVEPTRIYAIRAPRGHPQSRIGP
jgi:hypothetical protein